MKEKNDTQFQATILEFLEALPTPVIQKLYLEPAVCLAIFSLIPTLFFYPPLPNVKDRGWLLPTISKQIIMSILYIKKAISTTDVMVWRKQIQEENDNFIVSCTKRLRKLHIITDSSEQIYLNDDFREHFIMGLTGGSSRDKFSKVDKDPEISVGALDRYTTEKWESILHYMVGTKTEKYKPGSKVLKLLERANLMKYSGSKGQYIITSQGFQFLLQDLCSQIWTILLQYLSNIQNDDGNHGSSGASDSNVNNSDVTHMRIERVMKVFFQFGSLKFGKVYKLANTTYDQIEAKTLKDLNELGFVYYCKSGRSDSIEFIPTRLICILTGASVSSINTTISLLSSSKTTSFNDYSGVVSGGNAGADGSNMGTLAKTGGSGNEEDNGGASDPGFIIVETNYRLYAYTDSILQISILSLFVQLTRRFTNLVTGIITRESIKRALRNGITSEQIVTYLTMYAHPIMKTNTPPIPISVTDQIRLWELEKNRLVPTSAYLYHEFSRQQDFDSAYKYAEQLGAVCWVNPKKRVMAINSENHDLVKDFVKKRMTSMRR